MITELVTVAREHHCAGVAIENLGFDDARAAGREPMGRVGRGKKFRRTVAGIPTAEFRERLRSMAFHNGLVVIAVDPACTSIWGERYWKTPLQQQTQTTVTRHHGAGVAVGRRGLGHGARRRPCVTAHHQRMVERRATGQTVHIPRPRGTASPPRRASTPTRGDKTRPGQGDLLALFPDLEDRSRGHRTTRPDSRDSADTGQLALERLTAVDGVTDALDSLSAAVCVASSGDHAGIRRSLDIVALSDRFEGCVFSAADVPRGKPAPDMFLHAARSLGVEPRACAVVEDSAYGVEAARAAGMRVFGYCGGLTPASRPAGPGTVVFDDMRDLPGLLAAAG